MILARWASVAFALVQVATYTEPYPDGIKATAFGLVTLMALSNGVTAILVRRLTTPRALTWLALAALAVDVLVASAIVWVYAFDPISAIFVVLVMLPIEGAMHFGLPGALWTWLAVSLLYLVREGLGTLFGDPWEWTSVSFRVGVIGIVALVVGQLVRDLERQRELAGAALAVATKADEWRSRLVSMLAHDVRAPLAGMRTGFSLLEARSEQLSPEQASNIRIAGIRQADRALLLARDLLDMARSESGVLRLETGVVDVVDLVEEVSLLGDILDALVLDVPPGLTMHADRGRLEQVLHNLLSNAQRYGAPPYVVTARVRDSGVELIVRDHGPGLPVGHDLFAEFSGVGEGSVGLGTWTAHALVVAHGGTISHRHADPGAEFTIWLPDAADVSSDATPTTPTTPLREVAAVEL